MNKFYYVYILQSQRDNNWYIGFTSDVSKRLKMHNSGWNVSTRHRKPLKLIYFEAYLNEQDAKGREKFLKSGSGHRFLKKQIKNYIESN